MAYLKPKMNIYKKLKQVTAQKNASNELKTHYEELFKTSVSELKFEKLRVEHLLNTLEEIKTITDDNLLKKLINNELERDNVDKLIHYRTII